MRFFIKSSMCHDQLMVDERCWMQCALVQATWPWQVELSWQQLDKWQWADICSWARTWLLSWHIRAKLTEHSWANRLQVSFHSPNEEIDFSSFNTWQLKLSVSSELIGCSSADKLQLTWQLSWQVATEPSDSILAELKHIAAELPLLQLSWQTELTDRCQADMSWLRRQTAAEMTDCKGSCTS